MAPRMRTAAWLLALAGGAPHLAGGLKELAPPGGAISASSSKQITAVVDTLSDIVQSVQSEQAKESKMFQDFQAWCKSEKKNLASALDSAENQKESSDVFSKETSATISQLETRLSEIETAIKETQDIMAKAESVRSKESDENEDDMTLNRQSLDQVQRAIKIVQKVHQPGLVQDSALRRYQISEPGESKYVLGIMKGLQEKLEKTRANLQSQEKKRVEMHNMFMSTNKGEMENLQNEKNQKRNTLTETKINLVELKHILERSKKKVIELTKIVKDTADLCFAKEASFKLRSTEREQELAALKEAIAAIKSGALQAKKGSKLLQENPVAMAFVQLESSKRHRNLLKAHSGAPAMAQVKAQAKAPGGAAGRDHSKTVVQKLIDLLDKQQGEEKDKRNYCKAELDKKNKERTDTSDTIKGLKAQIDSKSGEIGNLVGEVKEMEGNIEKMKKGLEEATKLRKQEKKTYEETSKDRKLAIKVLKQAQQVLKQFYATHDKTALLQKKTVKAPPAPTKPPQTWSDKSTRKTIRSATALELMDKVAGEIAEEEKKAAGEEQKAAAAYEKLQNDNRAEFDRLMEEITQRVKRKAKLVVQLNSHKEELTQSKADLEALNQQIMSLHKECDELLKNYEKRAKARGWEKNQLRDVIDILAGSSVAVRTGLVQAAAKRGPRDHDSDAALDDTAASADARHGVRMSRGSESVGRMAFTRMSA
eukprot:CAMPEP_0176053934 /NCGR_PEP_ID=MMETSP0120_2-20121206/26831_1 /TAXON_ID=160619 /ORGANISM="Kryptoperidinium foliaceum, Strain CCMP 1326" /LENGTH=708 /DNA_ID=CAMNT_0017387395 /DNA_START=79 /DNA_END=2202 /DNA_ORIENTATION=-